MNKKMILITRRFPYFTTEAFIESEMKYVAAKFDEVLIFPSEISDYKRTVPHNVKVVDDFSKIFKNKNRRAFRTVFSLGLYKAIFDSWKEIKNISDIILVFKYMSSYLAYYDFFSKRDELKDASVVYTYWLNSAPLAFSKLKENKGSKFKVISRAHRYDIYEGLASTPSFWPYRLRTMEETDSINIISSNGKSYLEEKYPTDKSNIIVSRLGVSDRYNFAPNSSLGHYSIVSVSRVHPMKRVRFIFESICAFAEVVPGFKVKWTHFGDGPELLKIEKAAEEIGLDNLVFDFRGNVSNEVVYKHYSENAVDLFINLSSSEGIPVSIMEAQSFGIPAIATDVGGSGEIVVSQTGILLAENPTVAEVVSALNTVLVIGQFKKEQVKEFWAENYDADKNYSEFSNSILKLLS